MNDIELKKEYIEDKIIMGTNILAEIKRKKSGDKDQTWKTYIYPKKNLKKKQNKTYKQKKVTQTQQETGMYQVHW